MGQDISYDTFAKQIDLLTEETFQKVHGYFLDGGTSILETIAPVSAEEASRAPVPGGSTVAGHVAHVRFYLRIARLYMTGNPPEKTDWKESWQVHEVSEAEWDALREGLAADYKDLRAWAATADWNVEDRLTEMMAAIAHTAFHLGSIRQMLRFVRK